MVAHVPVGLAELTLDGVFTLVNPALCAITGYGEADLLNRPFLDMTHPDDRAHGAAQFWHAVATGESVVMDTRYVRPDGTVVWASDSVAVLHDATGQPARVVMVVTDITARKQVEQALRASEAMYRTLFESIDEGFCVVEMLFDAHGTPVDYRFLATNALFEHHTGLVHAVGKTARDLVPTLEAHWFELYGTVARTGTSVRFEQHAADMQDRWFEVYVSRVGGDDSRTVALVFKDITARKRRDAQLAFFADVADDFARLTSADELMHTVGVKLGAYLKIACSFLVDLDEARDEGVIHYLWHTDDVPPLPGSVRLAAFVTDAFTCAARAGETVVVHDTATDPRTDAARTAAINVRSLLSVPFHTHGAWNYVLIVGDTRPRAWRTDDIDLFRELANRLFPRLERARAEAAVRESEARVRLMVDAVPQSIWITDAEGRAEFLNKQWCDYCGVPFEPTTAAEMAVNFIHPADGPLVMAAFGEAMRTGSTFEIEQRNRSAAGEYRWFLNRAAPYRDPTTGTITKWFGVGIDIHDRKRAEEAVRESEARFHAVADLVPDLLWSHDPRGVTDWYNQRWVEYTGQTFEVSNQYGWIAVVHPDDAEQAQRQFRTAVDRGEALRHEQRIRRADGTYRWFLVQAQPVRDDGGTIVRWYGAATDIHEERMALAEAEAALHTREQFLSIASHELRTPLTALLGYAMMLPRSIARYVTELHADTVEFLDGRRD
jgi:PAS domain S-box-containing protein